MFYFGIVGRIIRVPDLMEKLEQNYQKAVDLIRNRESIQPHQNASPSVNILKVTQLDGVRLDLEIVELLSQQYFRSFSFFRVRFEYITCDVI